MLGLELRLHLPQPCAAADRAGRPAGGTGLAAAAPLTAANPPATRPGPVAVAASVRPPLPPPHDACGRAPTEGAARPVDGRVRPAARRRADRLRVERKRTALCLPHAAGLRRLRRDRRAAAARVRRRRRPSARRGRPRTGAGAAARTGRRVPLRGRCFGPAGSAGLRLGGVAASPRRRSAAACPAGRARCRGRPCRVASHRCRSARGRCGPVRRRGREPAAGAASRDADPDRARQGLLGDATAAADLPDAADAAAGAAGGRLAVRRRLPHRLDDGAGRLRPHDPAAPHRLSASGRRRLPPCDRRGP